MPSVSLKTAKSNSQKSRGYFRNKRLEENEPPANWDFNFIEDFQKAYELADGPRNKEYCLVTLRDAEARRDFIRGSIMELRNLIQFDPSPYELKEPRWEIYKVSISFSYQCKEFDNGKNVELSII